MRITQRRIFPRGVIPRCTPHHLSHRQCNLVRSLLLNRALVTIAKFQQGSKQGDGITRLRVLNSLVKNSNRLRGRKFTEQPGYVIDLTGSQSGCETI